MTRRRGGGGGGAAVTISDKTERALGDTLQGIMLNLQRLNDRMDATDKWREEQDAERKRREDRTWNKTQNAPEGLRGNITLILIACGTGVSMLCSGTSALVWAVQNVHIGH